METVILSPPLVKTNAVSSPAFILTIVRSSKTHFTLRFLYAINTPKLSILNLFSSSVLSSLNFSFKYLKLLFVLMTSPQVHYFLLSPNKELSRYFLFALIFSLFYIPYLFRLVYISIRLFICIPNS